MHIEQKSFANSRIFSGTLLKLHSKFPWENFEELYTYWKFSNFFIIFGHWAKIIRVLGKNLIPELSKLTYRWPEVFFVEKHFFLKNLNRFNHTWTLCKKLQLSGTNVLARLWKLPSPVSADFLKENKHSTKYTIFLFTFGPGAKKVSFALQKIWARVVYTVF